MPASLLYAICCKAGGVAIADVMEIVEFFCRTAVAPNAFSLRVVGRISSF